MSSNTLFLPLSCFTAAVACLCLSLYSGLYLRTEKHAWVEIRGLTWELKNSSFLYLEKLLGVFCSVLWVIIHLCREYSSEHFILLLLSAASSQINTSSPVPLLAVHELLLSFSILFTSYHSGSATKYKLNT